MFDEKQIASEKGIGGGNWRTRFATDFEQAKKDFSEPATLQQFLDNYEVTIIDGAHRWFSLPLCIRILHIFSISMLSL